MGNRLGNPDDVGKGSARAKHFGDSLSESHSEIGVTSSQVVALVVVRMEPRFGRGPAYRQLVQLMNLSILGMESTGFVRKCIGNLEASETGASGRKKGDIPADTRRRSRRRVCRLGHRLGVACLGYWVEACKKSFHGIVWRS
jgi:hypothetical protein